MNSKKVTIGIISDTHGLLRKRAAEALKGSRLIIHAGDIDCPAVLDALKKIAPVVAVRGNMDRGAETGRLPEKEVAEIENHRLYVLHDEDGLDLDPATAGFSAVISGHTHQALIRDQNGVLFFNPGSAGPQRLGRPVTVGRLTLSNGKLAAEIIDIGD